MRVYEVTIYSNDYGVVKGLHQCVPTAVVDGVATAEIQLPTTVSDLKNVKLVSEGYTVKSTSLVTKFVTEKAAVERLSTEAQVLYHKIKGVIKEMALVDIKRNEMKKKKEVLQKLCTSITDPRALSRHLLSYQGRGRCRAECEDQDACRTVEQDDTDMYSKGPGVGDKYGKIVASISETHHDAFTRISDLDLQLVELNIDSERLKAQALALNQQFTDLTGDVDIPMVARRLECSGNDHQDILRCFSKFGIVSAKEVKCAVILLQSTGAETTEEVELDVEFGVGGVSWTPLYDFRFQSSNMTECVVTYIANVHQQTQIDFAEDAVIYLSTTNSFKRHEPVLGGKRYVDIREPPKPMPQTRNQMRTARVMKKKASAEMAVEEAECCADAAMDEGAMVEDREGFGDRRLKLKEGTVIRHSPVAQRIYIAEIQLPCALYHHVIPRDKLCAYRVSYIRNESDWTLLPSTASTVYLDNRLCCMSRINRLCAPGDELCLYFGVDPCVSLSVLRNEDSIVSSTGYFGAGQKQSSRFQYKVVNDHPDHAVKVVFSYALPTSKNQQVKVVINDNKIVKDLQRLKSLPIRSLSSTISNGPGGSTVGSSSVSYDSDVLAVYKNPGADFLFNDKFGSLIEAIELQPTQSATTVGLNFKIEFPAEKELEIFST